uniref:Uncharacterized protein n=1 Tax=Sander lucioperca TaxID=283035 RepID=A0A8C9ZUU2_SANLU
MEQQQQVEEAELISLHEDPLPCWTKSNLSKFENEALRQLSENNDIVIKPADKGSAVVLMDRKDYLWEGHRQLSDQNYYTKLDRPIYKDTIPLVNKILLSLYNKKFINHKQMSYLQGNNEPRMPSLTVSPPGRPIVSDCESETYRTAEYIDYYLNPLSIFFPSFLSPQIGLHLGQSTYNWTHRTHNTHSIGLFF